MTECESAETTVRTRRLLWAGVLIRMDDHRLPKRIMFGALERGVKRGRGGKEMEWTDCVLNDVRAFGIPGNWMTTALDEGVWNDTVFEGGRRFMVAWRKEEENAARTRQEKREKEKVGIAGTAVGRAPPPKRRRLVH